MAIITSKRTQAISLASLMEVEKYGPHYKAEFNWRCIPESFTLTGIFCYMILEYLTLVTECPPQHSQK